MLPFKKILCPTDFSEPSYEALKAAGQLAYHFGSELCIIHVVSPVPLMPMGVEPTAFNLVLYEEELMASSKRSLGEVLNHLETKEVKARFVAVRGDAADEIVGIADEENMDLIVIATRVLTGLDRLIFGSVAEKVVRFAKCPVLTVTSQASKDEGKELPPEKGKPGMTERGTESFEGKQEKETYQEKIEAQLKEWGNKIDGLKAKTEKSKTEIKMKYEKEIEDLRTKQGALQKKLLEMKESGEETWEGFKSSTEKSLDDLKETFDEAISKFKEKGEEVAEKVSRKKKAYVEKVEVQLREWGFQTDVLKAKAEKSKAEVKTKYLEQIQELKNKQEAAKQRLRELRESGDEAWEDFKEGMEGALSDMKKALKRAASRFKKS